TLRLFSNSKSSGDLMNWKFAGLAIIAGVCCMSMLTFAHHSVAANFDASKAMDVVGKVKEFEIRNPHSQITLQVPKPGGGVTEYYVEWSDKNALMRRSVPVNKIRVGDKITVNV